jgi:hypothetical protein
MGGRSMSIRAAEYILAALCVLSLIWLIVAVRP